MMLVYLLGGLVCLLVFLAAFLLLTPLCYLFQGTWNDITAGIVDVRMGLLGFNLRKSPGQEGRFRFSVAGLLLVDSALAKKKEETTKTIKTAKTKERQRKKGFSELGRVLDWLEKEILQAAQKTLGELWRECKPRSIKLTGWIGFADPYYTGLLAACRGVWPGVEVEPDFTREGRDISLDVKGRIILGVVSYYLLKLLFVPGVRRRLLSLLWAKGRRGAKGITAQQV